MKLSQKDLGKICILKNLKLFKGEDCCDYLKFIIQEIRENEGKVIITDRATRAFIVDEKYIQII